MKKYNHKELCKILDTITEESLPLTDVQLDALDQWRAGFEGDLCIEHIDFLILSNRILIKEKKNG